VVIPTYNRSGRAADAILSVLAQTYSNYELIVVDDGSSEDTSQIQELLLGPNHYFFATDHHGVSAARNFGARNAAGRWLSFLDSDDTWYPEKLSKQLSYLDARPEMLICQTQEEWIRNGRRVNPKLRHLQPDGQAFEKSLELCCISPSSVMIDRELFEKVGGFDERLAVCEDYDLWLRITAQYEVGLVPEQLICKQGGHADQLSKSVPAMDRFRVFSMVKLLARQTLLAEQRDAVCCALKRKLAPLMQGAQKRDNTMLYELYSSLSSKVEKTLGGGSSRFQQIDFRVFEDRLLSSLDSQVID
jgi:hypothetical protein